MHSVWASRPLPPAGPSRWISSPGNASKSTYLARGPRSRGRVVLTGDGASKIDLHKSINWLIRKAPGIEPSSEFRSLGFDVQNGWNDVWADTPEGREYLQSLDHYFVTLDQNGRFNIDGGSTRRL